MSTITHMAEYQPLNSLGIRIEQYRNVNLGGGEQVYINSIQCLARSATCFVFLVDTDSKRHDVSTYSESSGGETQRLEAIIETEDGMTLAGVRFLFDGDAAKQPWSIRPVATKYGCLITLFLNNDPQQVWP